MTTVAELRRLLTDAPEDAVIQITCFDNYCGEMNTIIPESIRVIHDSYRLRRSTIGPVL